MFPEGLDFHEVLDKSRTKWQKEDAEELEWVKSYYYQAQNSLLPGWIFLPWLWQGCEAECICETPRTPIVRAQELKHQTSLSIHK